MYEKFEKLMDKLMSSISLYIILFIVSGIPWGLLNFHSLDSTPATDADYKPLMEIQSNIVDDFNNVYSYSNTDIDISENKIFVHINSDECSITSTFDKEHNYLYTEIEDNMDASFKTAIGISILCGICGGSLGILLFWFIALIIDFILLKIDKKK